MYWDCAHCGTSVRNTYLCGNCRRQESDPFLLILLQHEREYRKLEMRDIRKNFVTEADTPLGDFSNMEVENVFGDGDVMSEDDIKRLRQFAAKRRLSELFTQWDRFLSKSDVALLEAIITSEGRKFHSENVAISLSHIEGKPISAATVRKRLQRFRDKFVPQGQNVTNRKYVSYSVEGNIYE